MYREDLVAVGNKRDTYILKDQDPTEAVVQDANKLSIHSSALAWDPATSHKRDPQLEIRLLTTNAE